MLTSYARRPRRVGGARTAPTCRGGRLKYPSPYRPDVSGYLGRSLRGVGSKMIPALLSTDELRSSQADNRIPTIERITSLVEEHDQATRLLRTRMEEDLSRYLLTPYDAGAGYRAYTSNEPMIFADKMISSLTTAELHIHYPVEKRLEQDRKRQDMGEGFLKGLLRANDERLSLLLMQHLKDMLSTYINVRGWWAGRAMLVKDPSTGRTYADITPFDPLHCYWGMGPHGLNWLCHRSYKTDSEIEAEFGLKLENTNSPSSPTGGSWNGRAVYDWYDPWFSAIMIDNQWAKPPTPHGSPRTPAFIGAVGPLPLFQSRNADRRRDLVDYGESIFKANRGLYDKLNLVMSTMLHLVALSRNHPFMMHSRDGSKTVEENPWEEGSQVAVGEGEGIELIELLKTGQDTGAFLGMISAEIQRGGLPYSAYGQLAFQLSGYAVNLLKEATESPINPRANALVTAYGQICGLLADQYATGFFDVLQLSGRTNNREWFDLQFSPEMIQGLGAPEITLELQTPQDDMQKMALAMQAREGPFPILSDRYIWDKILKIQDVDYLANSIKEQVGERMLPTAALYTVMKALEEHGRSDLAMLYFGELVKTGIFGMPPTGGQSGVSPGRGGGGGGGAGGGNGIRPEVSPAPAQGQPPPQPTPQAGPLVPPGTPRPGAREIPPVVRAWERGR